MDDPFYPFDHMLALDLAFAQVANRASCRCRRPYHCSEHRQIIIPEAGPAREVGPDDAVLV